MNPENPEQRKEPFMYPALFLLLLFYDVIEACVPMANYWDELAAFVVLCWGGYSFWRNPGMRKEERTNWLFLIALVVIGALGNVFHPGLQTNPIACIKDVVALCKFPVIFFLLERRSFPKEKQAEVIAVIAKISRWLVVITLIAVVAGRFVDLGFYTGEVRIVPTFGFVFSHPTFFISSYVMIAAALIAESMDKNRLFLLLDCFLLFMAQRTKGYIFIVFLALFVLLGEKRIIKVLTIFLGSRKEKLKPGRILAALLVMVAAILVLGRSKIEFFLGFGMEAARVALHVVGFRILVDYFPLGSGLGTFASYLSGRYYSNVYELYGISNVVGITKEKYNFISDVFWPYIYGQFGIFGLLIYVRVLFGIFLRQFRSDLTDASRIAVIVVWIYALIATTSEAYFTNGTGVQMALFLSAFIGFGSRKPERQQKRADQ